MIPEEFLKAIPNVQDSNNYYIYKDGIDFVWTDKRFGEYKNKWLYVFSDDISSIKEHPKEYGLDIVGDRVTFIDWNYHYNSIYDMCLMSLAKIMICGVGGFAFLGAVISRNVDYLVRAGLSGCVIEWERERT